MPGGNTVSRETQRQFAALWHEMGGVSRETEDRLATYVGLLTKWNRAVNLVGRRSLHEVWQRHILDCAQLALWMPPGTPAAHRTLVDLGSGAGLPGLVLAILGRGHVHLIEADQRKAVFLREAGRQTEAPVTVHAQRVSDMPDIPADVVTARAFARLPALLEYARPWLAGGAVGLFPKGREAAEELTEARRTWKIEAQCAASRSHSGGSIVRVTMEAS